MYHQSPFAPKRGIVVWPQFFFTSGTLLCYHATMSLYATSLCTLSGTTGGRSKGGLLQGSCASFLRCMLVMLLALGLAGCSLHGSGGSSSQGSSTSGGKAPRGSKPYTINGKTYYPIQDAHGFSETGIASWYGSDFHGKKTANGERYDMYGMTAAHKLLPFGTNVRVTNLDNGKSIVVRINDRGPFVASRIIDLTKTGAEKISMIAKGTARVRVEAIGTVPGLQPDGDMTGKFYAQVGAFGVQGNADTLVQKLASQGMRARTAFRDSDSLWRVQVGPYPTLNEARTAGNRLATTFGDPIIVAE